MEGWACPGAVDNTWERLGGPSEPGARARPRSHRGQVGLSLVRSRCSVRAGLCGDREPDPACSSTGEKASPQQEGKARS